MENVPGLSGSGIQRDDLVRFCYQLTGDREAAEDLAQETLVRAWRHAHQLREPERRDAWLKAIARNACRRWLGERKPSTLRLPSSGIEGWSDADLDREPADDVDLEIEIERGELAGLLDRAMGQLPPETRRVLFERYVEERPQAETALRLGLSEGAVAMRLRRGKLALRRVLTTELREHALSYGLIPSTADEWQPTRIWCPNCGRGRLEGRFRPEIGELLARCPTCSVAYSVEGYLMNSLLPDELAGIKGYRRGISRALEVIHRHFRVRAEGGRAECPGCHRWLPIRRGCPPWMPARGIPVDFLYVDCPRCARNNRETWQSLTWSYPAVRQFWKQHPRMRYLGERELEIDGRSAVRTGFEDLDGAAKIEVVSLRDTLEVLTVDESGLTLPLTDVRGSGAALSAARRP